jgi:hypothetical protein
MMKKLIITIMLIGIVGGANAALNLVVWDDASGEWINYENSTLTITPSTTITIGIQDDGVTSTGIYALGISEGPGELLENIDVLASGVTAVFKDDALTAESLGIENPFISMTLDVSTDAVLASTEFHCTGEGDVPLVIYDNDGNFADDLIIHQIPEPATLALLGLGGFLLRKRRSG